MNAGTIFVLCLAAGFLVLVLYLHHLSQRTRSEEPQSRPAEERPPSDRSMRRRPGKGPAESCLVLPLERPAGSGS